MRLLLALGFALGIDPDAIVQRATDALNSDWKADPSYACTEKDEVQKGGKVTSKTFEALVIEGSDYNFPLAVNDQPLTADRHKAELLKLREEVQRRKSESLERRRKRIAAWKKRRDENGELLLDFPTALTFHLIGEEVKDGHPAYAFSATPKPGIVSATRAQKVLTGIQGKAWVERDTFHPIRIECTVVKSVPVFGALASVLPGTDIDIGMTKVAESTWLINSVSMKLNVSKLHMIKSSEVTSSTYTNYRPNTDALEQLLDEANRN